MEYNKNNQKPVGKKLIAKARRTNIIHYLRAKHPDSIQFAAHPDEPDKFCWRGTGHDSITFFSVDYNDMEIFKYYRWSNKESDDGITYLVRYEGYSFQNAVRALAYFNDPFADEDYEEDPDEPTAKELPKELSSESQDNPHKKCSPPPYMGTVGNPWTHDFNPESIPGYDPYKIPYGVDEEEEYEDSPF